MEHLQFSFIVNLLNMTDDVLRRDDASREAAPRSSSLLKRIVCRVFGFPSRDSALQDATQEEERRAKLEALDTGNQGLITHITDIDRAHMQAFSRDHKAVVMERMLSATPLVTVVHHGENQFEKAVLNMHRERFLLIDLQIHEAAFTTVWYQKSRPSTAGRADVTMLLWENGEVCDSTTIMTWRILDV